MATIYATLVVNTSKLGDDPSNVPAACTLYDSNLDPVPSDPQDFTINANEGDKIIFNITAKNNETPVLFYKFGQESGGEAFDPFPTFPKWRGTVDKSGDYFIKFVVPSIQDTAFRLDPVIRVDT